MKARFSTVVKGFLAKIGSLGKRGVKVPSSLSCAAPGDFVMFDYADNISRLVLITRPIVKRPQTGNLLLTGFCIDRNFLLKEEYEDFGPEEVVDLYIKKGIPENSFRTYNMSKFKGDLIRIRV